MKAIPEWEEENMDSLEKFVHREFIVQELKFSELYRYLDRYINTKSGEYEGTYIKKNGSVKINHTVWLFWNQGLEKAPKLVCKCYESVCRNIPRDFDVILLSEKTLEQYIKLPDFIWRNYEKGNITTTHLSDIIRLELLHTYGGCWIDATVFLSDKIPVYMLKNDMFMFKLPSVISNPVLKMSSWWITSAQANKLIHLTRQVLFKYWENEIKARNYFLFHIIMSKLIDEDLDCNNIFQSVPYFNSGNAHVLQGKLGKEYREDEWQIIRDTSRVHKLTHKNRYLQGDIYNYYTALLTNGLL